MRRLAGLGEPPHGWCRRKKMRTYLKNQKPRARRLPTIDLYDGEYFVDARLGEFRQVNNPHRRIAFDLPEEQADLVAFGKLYCSDCGQEIFVKLHGDERPPYCPDCGAKLG
jgi:hypothetical protein